MSILTTVLTSILTTVLIMLEQWCCQQSASIVDDICRPPDNNKHAAMPHSKANLLVNYFALRGFPINMNTLNCFVIIQLQISLYCIVAYKQCTNVLVNMVAAFLCSSALLTLKKHGIENKIVIFCHFITVKCILNVI